MVFKIIVVGSTPTSSVCFSLKNFNFINFFEVNFWYKKILILVFFFYNNLFNFFFRQKKFSYKNIFYIKNYLNFFFVKLYSIFFKIKNIFFSNFRFLFRVNKNYVNYTYDFNFFLYGLVSIWTFIKFWLLPLVLALLSFFYMIQLHIISLNKLAFIWFCVIMFFYWLISGFVFFIKKYQYGKFTSAIQRFWRRTFIIFWALETFLFLIFLYLVLNASNEPVYMYDLIQLNKTHLFSWKLFLFKLLPLMAVIFLTYILLINLKWSTINKNTYFILIITILLTYIVWLEFYQFFYTISWYGDLSWIFDFEEKLWNIDINFGRTRLVNNYVTICIIAKFWHLIFIYIFWVFFILRSKELNKIKYPLLSANFQNFIILFIMNFLLMYPWLKFLFKRYYTIFYHWFFLNNKTYIFKCIFNDYYIYFLNIVNIDFSSFKRISLPFFYLLQNSEIFNFIGFRKFFIKDFFITSLKFY